jgi:hypothetical protein
MEFTFNTLHIQQSAVFAYSTCVRLAHTFGAALFLFRLPLSTAMNNNVAVFWDATPCSLSTFRMNLLPPSSGHLYPCLSGDTYGSISYQRGRFCLLCNLPISVSLSVYTGLQNNNVRVSLCLLVRKSEAGSHFFVIELRLCLAMWHGAVGTAVLSGLHSLNHRRGRMSKFELQLGADSLICSLRHCECDGHTVLKLNQRRLTAD